MQALRRTAWHLRRRNGIAAGLLRLVGPLVLALFVLRSTHPAALARTMAGAHVHALALAVVLNFVSVHFKVERWRILLRAAGVTYPLGRSWLAYLSSSYLGIVTPGRIGDALRATYVRREVGAPLAIGMASVLGDRICDLVAVSGFLLLSISRLSPALSPSGVIVLAAVAAALLVAGALALGTDLFVRAARSVPRTAARALRVEAWIALLRSLCSFGAGPLAAAAALSAAAFLVNYAQAWLLARAIGIPLSLAEVTALLSVATLASLVPISIAGCGVREVLFASIFVTWGWPSEAGVAFGVLVLGVMHLSLVLAGSVAWQLAPPPLAEGCAVPEAP